MKYIFLKAYFKGIIWNKVCSAYKIQTNEAYNIFTNNNNTFYSLSFISIKINYQQTYNTYIRLKTQQLCTAIYVNMLKLKH